MPNIVRHILGVPIGIVLTVATWLGLGWASNLLIDMFARYFRVEFNVELLLAALTVVVLAVLLGLVTSARFMSPVAALIPGAVFLVLGTAFVVLRGVTAPGLRSLVDGLFDFGPGQTGLWTYSLSAQGIYPLLGVLLIVSAIPPHRWRAAPPKAVRNTDGAPYGPPGAPAPGPAPYAGPGAPAERPSAPPAPPLPSDDQYR